MAVIGLTLHNISGSGTGTAYYSPWFARQGNAATFSLELIARSAMGMGIKVTVETKNSDDKDSSATALGNFTVSSLAIGTHREDECQELVRFKYELTGGSTANDWVHFRMLNPSWESN